MRGEQRRQLENIVCAPAYVTVPGEGNCSDS